MNIEIFIEPLFIYSRFLMKARAFNGPIVVYFYAFFISAKLYESQQKVHDEI